MYHKVKIKKLPNKAVGGGINGNRIVNNQLLSWGGADFNMAPQKPKVTNTISGVSRKKANLEAEGGETVYGDINGDGMAEHLTIQGPRHSSGGVPLNLPDNTFIFSDTKSMRIKDPDILAKFGKSSGSYTPADLAKQYNLSKYRKILQDPDSDVIDKKTAELMIRNYNMKLGGLALAQESKKGFPQGIPDVARPFMEAHQLRDEDLIPQMAQQGGQNPQEEMMEQPMAQEGYEMPNYNPFDYAYTSPDYDGYDMTTEYAYGGSLPKAQTGVTTGATPKLSKEEQEFVNKKWNGKVDDYLKFKQTVEAIRNNKEFRQKLFNQYQEVIKNDKNYTGGKKSNWYDALKGRSEEEVVNALLAQEERNRRLAAYGHDAYKTSNPRAKGSNTNKETEAFIRDHKDALGDLDFSHGHVSQAAYIAYDDLMNAGKPKGYDISQSGVADELEGRPTISGIDNVNTNTTLKQYIGALPGQEKPKEVNKKCYCTAEDGTMTEIGRDDNGACLPCGDVERPDTEDIDVQGAPTVNQAEWMTPDLVNYFGAIKDKSMLRRFMPWAPVADLESPTATYIDYARELAKQSENANIASQVSGQFAGSPQAASSILSSIQGAGAEQAANTMANVNAQNVGIANQFAQTQANINNQEQGLRQQAAQKLYDQNTLANQQYLNSKLAANQNIRQAFNTGWKNASNLALTNAMYDQYDIDPRTGTVVFQGGKELDPERAQTFDSYVQYYRSQGFDPKDAINAAKTAMGQTPSILDGYGKDGGMYVMGSNVFPPFFY